jgi:hypothetical protein
MIEEKIYLRMMDEAMNRLAKCEQYVIEYGRTLSVYECEAASLQMRKAMEAIAFASIAPNKSEYIAAQKEVEKATNLRDDWNARRIFLLLSKINPDFYPKAMVREQTIGVGSYSFGTPGYGGMTQKRFETFYNRLGKLMHGDNPWGNAVDWAVVAAELSDAIRGLRILLSLHRTTIRKPNFNGVWIVDAPAGLPAVMHRAEAVGEFVDTNK